MNFKYIIHLGLWKKLAQKSHHGHVLTTASTTSGWLIMQPSVPLVPSSFAEEWEKRDLIVNFKGNSELTTEIDHQQAVGKAIDLVTDFIKKSFGETASSLTFACICIAAPAYRAPLQAIQ